MFIRFHKKILLELLKAFPVVAVIGPRQVGKSTLVTSSVIGEGRDYLSLDDISLRSVAASDPKAFLARSERLTIDEIQLVPDLLRAIKYQVDKDRQPGRFLITGSADLDHCADLSEILAGRVGILRLPPVCQSEASESTGWQAWLDARSVNDLDKAYSGKTASVFDFNRILTGGFPLALTAANDRARQLWFESFRMTYLERDLRRISDISHLAEFNRLMELTAGVSGTLLNQAHLARDAGMSPATAGRYLSVLEASLLIHRLSPYFANIGKRLVKSPKLYWADTGLCAYLLGLETVEQLSNDPLLKGRLFESFVMMEVKALLEIAHPSARLLHLRTHDQLEVDGVIHRGQGDMLFEIKASQTVTAEDAKPMERWMSHREMNSVGVVIYAGVHYTILSNNVRAIPASMLFG